MRYLGLDLGTKTLGIAISDRTGMIASFYKSIRYSDEDFLIDSLREIILSLEVSVIVLGFPKNMDNSVGFRAKETLLFKEKLEVLGLPVVLEDERLTTTVAESVLIDANMSRKKRKKVIDGVSAVVILQSYLDRKDRL